MILSSTAARVSRGYERVAAEFESGIQALERRYTPLGRFTPGPFSGWQFLWQPALVGFIALSAIFVGSSFSDSPFKLNYVDTWFFGIPTRTLATPEPTNQTTLMVSILLVLGGLILLMRVWLRLAEVLRHHPGSPVKTLWKILALWSVPMIVAPPLFSRDVFSYAAQGELVSHHLSPYVLGPFSIGSGPIVNPVDPLWGNSPAPYGPFFLFLEGAITRLADHHELEMVLGLRLLEVVAVALLAYTLPLLARAMGRDPGEALVLGVLNPLVLLTLIGGAHNDALMAALLVTGLALAAMRHPMWGVFFCACATAIKAPAALGILYIAWTWLGPDIAWRRKVNPFVVATVITSATLCVFTFLAGFGFGWIANLATPGSVRSWAAPATGIGLALAHLAHALGSTVSIESVITVTRAVGLAAAVAISLWLVLNADRRGWLRSLAVSLLLFVILGPVVQPWYLVWGLVILCVSYVGREHFWILVLSIGGPFLGLSGGEALDDGVLHANPFALIGVLICLALVLIVPMGNWTQWSWPEAALHAD